jgi:hypothetical protein
MIYNDKVLASKDPCDILDSFGYLRESYTTANMVAIRYSDRLEQNMIQLESMVDFAITNGIDNAEIAIKRICEDNHIDENITFCVNETSLYEDIQMLDTVKALKENQYRVNIMPISKDSIYYTKLQEALAIDDDCIDYDTSEALMQYVNEGIIGDTIDRAKTRASNAYNYVKDNLTNNVSNLKENRNALASKYASIKRTIGEKYEAAKRATGEAKVKFLQQINKLKVAANNIKQKLSSSNQ